MSPRVPRHVRAELPRPEEKARAVRAMFDAIAPRYDLVNRVMTFGLDVRWRRKTVALLDLPRQSLVLDVACGTGDLCRDLLRAGHRPIGLDFSFEMLANANGPYDLVQADALALPLRDGSVDGVTSGFALRNVADLDGLLAETARVVRKGGRIALLEVAEPSWRPARAVHKLYFHKVVPLIGGWLSDRAAYSYLPQSTAYLPAPDRLIEQVAAAGFGRVNRRLLAAGASQVITGTRS